MVNYAYNFRNMGKFLERIPVRVSGRFDIIGLQNVGSSQYDGINSIGLRSSRFRKSKYLHRPPRNPSLVGTGGRGGFKKSKEIMLRDRTGILTGPDVIYRNYTGTHYKLQIC